LQVVGVHTPEFGFEREYANVEAAVREAGIEYPVVSTTPTPRGTPTTTATGPPST
jgi:hypothetical protein